MFKFSSQQQPSSMKTVVIGNPDNRRVAMFQAALKGHGCPPAVVVAYADLLAGRVALENVVERGSMVRIDSPGENFEVEKALLTLGAEDARCEDLPCLGCDEVERLSFDQGLIIYPGQWYLGYIKLLIDIREQLDRCDQPELTNSPKEIMAMFDKRFCHLLCRSRDIPVPRSLEPVGSYAELLQRMDEAGMSRVFVKLAHGSSASGVVAFHRSGKRQQAITSAELVRDGDVVKLYNSLKVRRYTEPDDIAAIIDTLCGHGVHVEQWLPKASWGMGTFDLRVVVIDGTAKHFVVRRSRGPMTNLHLRNRRGNAEEFLSRIGTKRWREIRRTCERAAAVFPKSLHVGVDVCITPGFRSHAVLEINAFGDLLPGVLCDGQDTYSAEVAAMLKRHRNTRKSFSR